MLFINNYFFVGIFFLAGFAVLFGIRRFLAIWIPYDI